MSGNLYELLGEYYDYTFYEFNKEGAAVNSIIVVAKLNAVFIKVKQQYMIDKNIEFDMFDGKIRCIIFEVKENKENFIAEAIDWVINYK